MKNSKINCKLLFLLLIVGHAVEMYGINPGGKTIDKKYYKMQEKADKMTKYGALAVVGMAIESSSRHDLGRTKAKADAMAIISEQMEVYIESVIYDFKQSVTFGSEEKYEEVFRTVTKTLSKNVLHGIRIIDFDCYQTKENKKENKNTYLVLLVISPQYTFQSLFDELNKSEDEKAVSLYKRFKDSEGEKTLELKIEDFEKKFKKDF